MTEFQSLMTIVSGFAVSIGQVLGALSLPVLGFIGYIVVSGFKINQEFRIYSNAPRSVNIGMIINF